MGRHCGDIALHTAVAVEADALAVSEIEYSIPQIKFKGSKFTCSLELIDTNKDNNIKIIDKTKEMKDFVCAPVLEDFYEDENYTYYFNCIKSSYVVVKYEDGKEEPIKDALKNKNISINDLNKNYIGYIKKRKQ